MANGKRKFDWQEPVAFHPKPSKSLTIAKASLDLSWTTPSHCQVEEKCKLQKQPDWMTPLVTRCAKDDKAYSGSKMPEIRLTIGELLLACKPESTCIDKDAWHKGNGPAELASLLKQPCPFGRSSSNRCSVCENDHEYHDVFTFRSIWNQMDTETRSHYLCALHQREVDSSAVSRAQWIFLGKRVCIERLLQILGTSKRAYYRQVGRNYQLVSFKKMFDVSQNLANPFPMTGEG